MEYLFVLSDKRSSICGWLQTHWRNNLFRIIKQKPPPVHEWETAHIR